LRVLGLLDPTRRLTDARDAVLLLVGWQAARR
jgi:hypothetical protein